MFNICRCNSSCSIYVWADCGWFLRNRRLWGTLRCIRCFYLFVVCSVVIGASQTIRKTCEWSLLLSEILSCVEYNWKYCFYVLYFQVYKEQPSCFFGFLDCSLCKYIYINIFQSYFKRCHDRNHMEFWLTIYMMSSTKITETEFHSCPWQGVCDKFVSDFWQIHEFHLPLKLK